MRSLSSVVSLSPAFARRAAVSVVHRRGDFVYLLLSFEKRM